VNQIRNACEREPCSVKRETSIKVQKSVMREQKDPSKRSSGKRTVMMLRVRSKTNDMAKPERKENQNRKRCGEVQETAGAAI